MLYVYLYGGLAGALITFIVAVILFIKLDIIEVIYDLLGIRRRRRKLKKKKKWDKKPVPIILNEGSDCACAVAGGVSTVWGGMRSLTVEMEDTVLLSDSEERRLLMTATRQPCSVMTRETRRPSGEKKPQTHRSHSLGRTSTSSSFIHISRYRRKIT